MSIFRSKRSERLRAIYSLSTETQKCCWKAWSVEQWWHAEMYINTLFRWIYAWRVGLLRRLVKIQKSKSRPEFDPGTTWRVESPTGGMMKLAGSYQWSPQFLLFLQLWIWIVDSCTSYIIGASWHFFQISFSFLVPPRLWNHNIRRVRTSTIPIMTGIWLSLTYIRFTRHGMWVEKFQLGSFKQRPQAG